MLVCAILVDSQGSEASSTFLSAPRSFIVAQNDLIWLHPRTPEAGAVMHVALGERCFTSWVCWKPTPTVLYPTAGYATGLSLVRQRLYWTDRDGGWSGDLSGGPRQRVTEAISAVEMRIDDQAMYWTTRLPIASGAPSDGVLMTLPLAGGNPEHLASGLPLDYLLAMDATRLYYVRDGAIRSLDKKTHLEKELVKLSRAPTALAVDAHGVYWATYANVGFWVNTEKDGPGTYNEDPAVMPAIMRAPLDGGVAQTIASSPRDPMRLLVDGEFIYWTAWPHSVFRARSAGGPFEVVATDQPLATEMASDARTLFWGVADGAVVRHPK